MLPMKSAAIALTSPFFFFLFALDCNNISENSMRLAEGITWECDLFFSAHIVINR